MLIVHPAMFYIGSNVMDWPLEGQRALADGVYSLFMRFRLLIFRFAIGHEICVRECHIYPLEML
jgi:hypothetical protein